MKDRQRTRPTTDQCKNYAVDHFPGASVDHAGTGEVSQDMLKERTRTLNNNPRNYH